MLDKSTPPNTPPTNITILPHWPSLWQWHITLDTHAYVLYTQKMVHIHRVANKKGRKWALRTLAHRKAQNITTEASKTRQSEFTLISRH